MSYYQSYDAAKTRRYHFLLEELLSLCNTVPDTRYKRGRPVEFPLPTPFVLLGLKFDTGLSYRDLIAFVDFNPYLSHRLGLDRTPSYSSLHKATISTIFINYGLCFQSQCYHFFLIHPNRF